MTSRFPPLYACAAFAVSLIAGTVLIGWWANLPVLTSVVPGWAAMKPLTALTFVLASAGLLLAGGAAGRGRLVAPGRIILGAIVGATGLLVLLENRSGFDTGLARLVAPARAADSQLRLSGATASALMLVGLALGLHRRHWGRFHPVPWLAGIVATLGLQGVVGYVLDPTMLYVLVGYASVSLPTSVGLVLLAIGLVAADPDDPVVAFFQSEALGSRIWRRFLLAPLTVSVVIGWLVVRAEQNGMMDIGSGAHLLAFVLGVLATLFLLFLALALNRLDAAGRRQATALHELNASLERRIAERTAQLAQRHAELQQAMTTRITAEASARQAELRYRSVAESLPQLVWTCRPDGRCDYLGPQWVAYTGLPEAEQLDFGWAAQLHPDDRERAFAAWRETVARGTPFDIDFRIRRHDGVYRWFKTRAVPLRDAADGIERWFGTNTDIDDTVQARASLAAVAATLEQRVTERTREVARAEERLRLATEAAAIGVWEWDVAAGTTVWDDTMRRIYDWPEGSMTFEHWRDHVVLPEDAAAALAKVETAMAVTGHFDQVFRIRRRDGTLRHIHAIGLVHHDPEGRPVRMVGINRDVTTEREAELQLRASEQLLREFIRHSPAAIAMLDTSMRYLQASARWLRDYHLEGQDIIGRSHYEVFPDIPQRWKDIHERVLAGAVESCAEDPFPREDGGIEWLEWEARPWHGADGRIGGLIFFTQVITARKNASLALERTAAELARSNSELAQFAYVASHDLQEPLRAVAGCVQILSRRYGPQLEPGARELIQHAVAGAMRMQTLIHDLLTVSRVGSSPIPDTPVSLERACDTALSNLTAAIAESGAVVTRAALPMVVGDPTQLAQLFQNLIGNGLKYRGTRPPMIRIEAEQVDSHWHLAVRDNGIGIEPQYFDRIFGIFQRLHTRTEYEGTGIGLALCKKIVERHGGRIWVDSTPGIGSTFYFSLPIRPTPSA